MSFTSQILYPTKDSASNILTFFWLLGVMPVYWYKLRKICKYQYYSELFWAQILYIFHVFHTRSVCIPCGIRAVSEKSFPYIETGVIPKYAGCVNGVNWFKDRGQWAENDIEPAPGMIIFFDWDNKGSSGPQDGESDHTGIVERVEDGIVYTVEGNSGDSCRENHYAEGYYEILGYGIPAY